jgi:MoaA/NifB/PqqE/SkfB family radical SAM enzyme
MRIRKWAKATLRAAWQRSAAVNLIVTRRCDLTCSYCTAYGKSADLSPQDWIKIARRIAHRFSIFTVSGGEPLLYKGLPEVINALSELGIAGLCTNARTLSESHLQAMQGLDYLNFSIDHSGDSDASPKTAYGKLPLMAEYARRRSFELRGTAVITSRNVNSIIGVAHELARYHIPLNLQLVQRPGPLNAFDTPEKVAGLKALQDELLALKRSGMAIDEPDDYIAGFVPFVEGRAAVHCMAGKAYLAIDSDGRLLPCQDTPAVGAPLHHDTTDIESALRTLPQAVPDQCRCWWNCYHRNAAWVQNPFAFVTRSLLDRQTRVTNK